MEDFAAPENTKSAFSTPLSPPPGPCRISYPTKPLIILSASVISLAFLLQRKVTVSQDLYPIFHKSLPSGLR